MSNTKEVIEVGQNSMENSEREAGSSAPLCSTFVAYSGGVESTTMLLLFGHKATPIFTDTGWEHQALYDWLDKVEEKTGHKITRIRAENVDGKNGVNTLPAYIKSSGVMPSHGMRYCTKYFKIQPMDRYLKERTPCEVMIGLNYEERDERTGNHGLAAGVTYSYPLVDLKITRQDCIDALKAHDLYPNFPAYMRRGGCRGCFYKSKNEYYRMARENPEEAYGVATLEEEMNADPERQAWFSIHPGIPNMRRFMDNARAQTELELNDDQSVPMSPCGVFCNR